ncbi:MAG: hypothetical protein JRI23_11065 [Deltaproteobacteria bacterium]|nr:hypothetical protein [Deltaproteobacteria bacterium]MBW2532222.1 hypothetical protein [Deltaproteobacteria bacterium]
MDRPVSDGLDLSEWQEEEPAAWGAADYEEPRSRVEPDGADAAACEALAARQQRCTSADEAEVEELDLGSCADQLACSRTLWSTDVHAVYRCLGERPCDDADPVMSCLSEVGKTVEPSNAELAFARELEDAETECGDLVEIAPRQADAIYDGLGFCLTENDECDVKAACVEVMLQAIVDRTCGEG